MVQVKSLHNLSDEISYSISDLQMTIRGNSLSDKIRVLISKAREYEVCAANTVNSIQY